MLKVITTVILTISLFLSGCSKQNDGSKNEIKGAFGYTFGEKVNDSMFSDKAEAKTYAERENYSTPYSRIFGVKARDAKYDDCMIATNADDEIYNINVYKNFSEGKACRKDKRNIADAFLKQYHSLKEKKPIVGKDDIRGILINGDTIKILIICRKRGEDYNGTNELSVEVTDNSYKPD